MPDAVRQRIEIVLTDIDDTLTTGGRLPASSYAAMERLQAGGKRVIPVTGRPAGWCDLIARQWPVDAVVGENGALAFRYDDERRQMRRLYSRPAAERTADRERLNAISELVRAQVPGARVAADQDYRVADLAIDYAEDVPRLPDETVQYIVELFENAGATAKVSSIHVNGWFGLYDKRSMALRAAEEFLGLSERRLIELGTFVGDSPNDAPMFGLFPDSVGVANIVDFAERIAAPPAWVTSHPGAAGFCELVDELLRDL